MFCPAEGCPKGFCARDDGWLPGMESPAECTGFHLTQDWQDNPGPNGMPEVR